MKRRNVLKGAAVGASVLSVSGVAAVMYGNSGDKPKNVSTTTVSLPLSESTVASNSETEAFASYIADKYPSGLLRGCAEDITGTIPNPDGSSGSTLQTKQLQETGNTWAKQGISVGNGEELLTADARVVEYEYVDNPVAGENHLHYRFWLAVNPSGSNSHLYNFWPAFSVSESATIEGFAPRTSPQQSSPISVQSQWNNPSEGGLKYTFPLNGGKYQLHPEHTTLTKSFAPQWLGDLTEPQIISGAAWVSRPRDADQDDTLQCFVAGSKYPKTI